MNKQNLANRIAFLETDIGTQTMAEELQRCHALQVARAEYGEEDAMLLTAIARRAAQVAQAQRDGEYD